MRAGHHQPRLRTRQPPALTDVGPRRVG
jgi:hypothetical protein